MRKIIVLTAIVATVLTLTACAPTATNNASSSVEPTLETSATPTSSPSAITPTNLPKAPIVDKGIATQDVTAEQLTYLIEEEKLAHDVYTAMLEKWGARVFGNILQSEQSHQSQVLTVMESRKIADPRSSKLGVFVNKDLQSLYDQLISKGNQSANDAYEVGVAIEELDIDDLTKMLATAKDADVISMMENLRRGSENHLRAFNNQL